MNYAVLIGRLLTLASTFFLNWLAARLLLPEETGRYFLAFSWVWLFSLAIQFGSNYSLNRWIPIALQSGDSGLVSERLKTTVYTSLFIYSVLALAVLIFFGKMRGQLGFSPMLFLVWVALSSLQSTLSEIFRSFSRIKMATLLSGPVAQIGTVLLAAFFYIEGATLRLSTVTTFTVVGLFLSCAFGVLKLRPLISPHLDSQPVQLIQSWKQHIDFFLVTIVLYSFSQVDIWVLGALAEKPLIAKYAIGQRVALLSSIPASIINLSLMPEFSRWTANGSRDKIRSALRLSGVTGGLPPIALLILLFFCGPWILQTVFGVAYRDSSPIAFVLTMGQTFHYLAGSQGLLLLMAGKQKEVLNCVFFSLCISTLLQVYLFHLFGVIGIAIGSSLGLAIQTIYFVFATRRSLGISMLGQTV